MGSRRLHLWSGQESDLKMEAWVTLATNDSYSVGALTLAASLNRVKTTRKKVCMVTDGISSKVLNCLHEKFDHVVNVEKLDSGDVANLKLLERSELGITFTKLHCWTLTQFSKCVFLDADTLVLANSDELFEREEFSAARDAGWPDYFNSGVHGDCGACKGNWFFRRWRSGLAEYVFLRLGI